MATTLAIPVTNETAAARIERALREDIVRLELLPGTRVSEQEIATRYGASRQPVREALIALAKSGFLETHSNRGTMVVKISVQQLLEARFVREAVEVAVVRRACEHFDPLTREQIEANLIRQKETCTLEDHNEFRVLDAQYHSSLAKGAGCLLAWHTIKDTKAQFDRVGSLMRIKRDNRQLLLEQHSAIVQAIDAHDADTAEAVIHEHLHYLLKDLPQAAAIYSDLFE